MVGLPLRGGENRPAREKTHMEENMKNMMMAACGLDCAQCNALLAWKNDDMDLRKKTALEWQKAFNFAFTPEMINCSGCLEAEGPKIGHCAECGVRACVQSKGLANCSKCADMRTCVQLGEFLKMAPEAKKNLEALA
jgi:hypothetical protein